MTKTKVGLIVFAITWIGTLCLFDYYRDDICNQSEMVLADLDDLPEPMEQVNLNV
jgi:hypothetical protein